MSHRMQHMFGVAPFQSYSHEGSFSEDDVTSSSLTASITKSTCSSCEQDCTSKSSCSDLGVQTQPRNIWSEESSDFTNSQNITPNCSKCSKDAESMLNVVAMEMESNSSSEQEYFSARGCRYSRDGDCYSISVTQEEESSSNCSKCLSQQNIESSSEHEYFSFSEQDSTDQHKFSLDSSSFSLSVTKSASCSDEEDDLLTPREEENYYEFVNAACSSDDTENFSSSQTLETDTESSDCCRERNMNNRDTNPKNLNNTNFLRTILNKPGISKVKALVAKCENLNDRTLNIDNKERIETLKPIKNLRVVESSNKKIPKTIESSNEKIPKTIESSNEKIPKTIESSNEKITKTIESSNEKIPKTIESSSEKIPKTIGSSNEKIPKTIESSNEKITKTIESSSEKITKTIESLNEKITKTIESSSEKITKTIESLNEMNLKTTEDLNVKRIEDIVNSGDREHKIEKDKCVRTVKNRGKEKMKNSVTHYENECKCKSRKDLIKPDTFVNFGAKYAETFTTQTLAHAESLCKSINPESLIKNKVQGASMNLFLGKWRHESSENWLKMIRTLGVPQEHLHSWADMKPTLVLEYLNTVDKFRVTFAWKYGQITNSFKLGEIFKEKTIDGELTKTRVTLESTNRVVQKRLTSPELTIVREINSNGMMVETCYALGVRSTMRYKRVHS